MDYASWVTDLSHQRITEIAGDYLPDNTDLETAFQETFGDDLPETLNESHSILIVAESMDPSTERIVKYLSDQGIPINVLTVQHFSSMDGKELLAQVFLMEPSETAEKIRAGSKRRQSLTREEIRSICEEKSLGTLYDDLLGRLDTVFTSKGTTASSLAFKGRIGEGGARVIFSLLPSDSDREKGLAFQVYTKRLADFIGISVENVEDLLPASREAWTFWGNVNQPDIDNWVGFEGFFKIHDEVAKFTDGLAAGLKK